MAVFQVKAPIPAEPLTLLWDDGEVVAKGDEVAKVHWQNLQSDGLFGRYGHTVDLENVTVVDLYSALVNRVGRKNIKLDASAKAELKKGVKDKASVNEIT